MIRISALAAFAALSFSTTTNAAIIWANWDTSTYSTQDGYWEGAAGTLGETSINYTGKMHSLSTNDSAFDPNFWVKPNNSPYGAYSSVNAPANKDFLGVVGNGQSHTISFGQTVVDPTLLISSLGALGTPVTWAFDSAFQVLSQGVGYHYVVPGYESYSINGNSITGQEFNGVLQFQGEFDSLTFTTNHLTEWAGLTVGIRSLASPPTNPWQPGPNVINPSAVPELDTWAMLIIGFGVVGFAIRKRRKSIPVVYT